ncbi:hypothetical protein [Bacillus salipaludis]|uniref:Uncharacterized protein n=1 Tax=Bacillus salipaludis TaxID=2547811 RepID=A0ABW8RBZ0_9BACI
MGTIMATEAIIQAMDITTATALITQVNDNQVQHDELDGGRLQKAFLFGGGLFYIINHFPIREKVPDTLWVSGTFFMM